MKIVPLLLVIVNTSVSVASDVFTLNSSRIGKSIQESEPLLSARMTNAIPPSQIQLELKGVTLVGAVLEYPKEVTKEMLRECLNSRFASAERKFTSGTVYGWRDEVNRISILIGEGNTRTTLIVRTIDKELLQDAPSLKAR